MSDSMEDNVDLESLKWSEEIYTLEEFLKKLDLPQIVCVRDGYYDLEDITTLSTDQVLTLHTLKTCRMVKGISETNEEISIPTNIQGRVELMPSDLPKMYKSVKAVTKDWPKMVISLHNHVWLGLMTNDVLKLETVKRKRLKEFLCCSFVNKEADVVELPMSYEACFQSYEEPKHIEVNQIESHCKMPCYVKIHAKSPIKPNVDDPSETLDLSTFGRIQLVHAYNYRKIIASIRDKERTSVMQIPVDLEITIMPASGAIERESRYESICSNVHQKTQLGQLDGMELDFVKMGDKGNIVDNIYEYIDFSQLNLKPSKPEVAPKPAHLKEKPAVPPRDRRTSMKDHSHASIKTETTPLSNLESTISPPESPAKTTNNTDFTIPEDLKSLTVEEVANCLSLLHMDMYTEKFKEEQIDGDMLVELNEEMLEQSLGVTNKLHQKKLMKVIREGWRPKSD
ncbi:uncharacterized protein LOC116308280 [Actinia tenebrosa]|uniref:Uncharacterized protein LOC116308280 n=1 Tax=Actinia tenebrosa TaxID=6105 RepID=A0A6P8J9W4_ACTTE|nr:uncharacterized protein LOC116308280 [Actinia tenebrosa]